jgi:hypothetical protein
MVNQDIVAISHLIAIENDWSEGRRNLAVEEYEQYLALAAKGYAGSPPSDVDELWHRHILNTLSYVRYCDIRFGRYIHHVACLRRSVIEELRSRIGTVPGFLSSALAQPPTSLANCGSPNQPPDLDETRPRDFATRRITTGALFGNCGPSDPRGPDGVSPSSYGSDAVS